MIKHLDTNRQFMIGNGILAFAVIFVVVVFVYMSMRVQPEKEIEKKYAETYTVTLAKGFTRDSLSLFINDSLLLNKRIVKEPISIKATRFAEQNALIIVDNLTDRIFVFDLSEKGEAVFLIKDINGIRRLLSN
ncbi:hypothetical protein EZS27_005876 [termite gut metagenome]|uniref:Transmembrane protein n=1 Tax=termite gut metagenome TaxID=433724 RepID=A0A5J4SMI5_9ZZZZ